MAISTAFCTSCKVELLQAIHDFSATGGSTFKIALYSSSASLGASTTAYSTTNEISGTGYTAGGNTLTNVDPTSSSTTAYTDFDDSTWSSASFTAAGCLIYNSSQSNRAVSVHSFSGDKTSTGGAFQVQFPTADASNAILRLA